MKTTPYKHQQKTFDESKDLEYYALWWEMGLGKSKELIDTVCHLYLAGKITGLLVVAPNGVHGNFTSQEMPVHTWDGVSWQGYTYHSGSSGSKREQSKIAELMRHEGLAVLVMSYDGVKTVKGHALAIEFLKSRKSLGALDESTFVADPDTERSKKTLALGLWCRYRRVMSGTPVAEGPFKIFNQMRFLDAQFWKKSGLQSFFAFKNTFGLFQTQRAKQGHQFQQLLEYRNLDYLHKLIADVSSRVLKEDALDLPPKVYTRIQFDMAPHQRKIYDDLVDSMRAQVTEDAYVEVALALVKMTRLQQLTSGYAVTEEKRQPSKGDVVVFNTDSPDQLYGEIWDFCEAIDGDLDPVVKWTLADGIERYDLISSRDPRLTVLTESDPKTIDIFGEPFPSHTNPRLEALMTTLEPITHKVLLWARFKGDIDRMMNRITDDYGPEAAVRYDGQVKTKDREIALDRFRRDPKARFFVANPQAISMGVTLVQAKTVGYYSNSFRLEHRLQSEDRAHRIGQDTSVTIFDLVANDSIDDHIVETLRTKFDLAATVMGDRLRSWLR